MSIYMTEKSGTGMRTQHRWLFTDMCGTLKLSVYGEIERIPFAMIKLMTRDQDGNEGDSIFEYELPLNFEHDCNLSPTFYSVRCLKSD